MTIQLNPAIKKSRGVALFLALIFMLMLAIIATTTMQTALLQMRMAGNDQFLEEAFQRAEAIADELSQSPRNFLLDTEVGDSNCPLDPKVLDCEIRLLRLPVSAATSKGYELDYRITRQDPLLWQNFPVQGSQAKVLSSNRFDAAIFEVDVRVDGSATRRGSAHVIQGVAARMVPVGGVVPPSAESPELYDADMVEVPNISTLASSSATAVYRIYWRQPGIDSL
ncbi:MAG: pilus assembly PilX N-terminal domain-containing protein [Halioglobus sp.]|nr:pilus assembly PilX N-terminal domain-containing protein [Halioglobus sp.]